MPIKISSITLAKNSQETMFNCINSQKKCIDEINIFIDDSTTDQTENIVKKLNVNYLLFSWKGYSNSKKFAIEKVNNDWIFWIDSDEVITDELAEEINVWKNSVAEAVAYKIKRRAFFLGKWIKHGGWYPGKVIRLFNKKSAKFSDSLVHEYLEIEGKIEELSNDLEHYTDQNIKHYFDKFNTYTSLAAEELNKKYYKFKIWDILFRPLLLFMKMYIFRGGFIDGLQGFILAIYSANYVFVKYTKLWEIEKTIK